MRETSIEKILDHVIVPENIGFFLFPTGNPGWHLICFVLVDIFKGLDFLVIFSGQGPSYHLRQIRSNPLDKIETRILNINIETCVSRTKDPWAGKSPTISSLSKQKIRSAFDIWAWQYFGLRKITPQIVSALIKENIKYRIIGNGERLEVFDVAF